MPFPAAADTYPGKDAVADYLRAYAAEFGLPVRLDTTVESLTRTGEGGYLAKAGKRVVVIEYNRGLGVEAMEVTPYDAWFDRFHADRTGL